MPRLVVKWIPDVDVDRRLSPNGYPRVTHDGRDRAGSLIRRFREKYHPHGCKLQSTLFLTFSLLL
jgi:hypothetical protein